MLSMLAPLTLRLLDVLVMPETLLAALTLRLLDALGVTPTLLDSLALLLLGSLIFGIANLGGLMFLFVAFVLLPLMLDATIAVGVAGVVAARTLDPAAFFAAATAP